MPASATVDAKGGGAASLSLAGDWTLAAPLPDSRAVVGQITRLGPVTRVTVDGSRLGRWDSVLPAFLFEVANATAAEGAVLVADAAPEGLRRLLAIALAVPPRTTAASESPAPLLARIGKATERWWDGIVDAVTFTGEVVLALLAFLRGRAKFRTEDVARVFYAAGPAALPIVTLIGLLAGFILAFSGGNELQMFGAQIYVANLVTTGMAQEMGPLMAAVIMAGRTGAAFAAELGTMQVNQETDALRTLGVDPIQFLVVPRMLALMLMLPLLACYAIMLGILGGWIVGVTVFDINPLQYAQQMRQMIGVEDFAGGIFKAAVFGAIVALAGCLRGMRSGQDAAAVGNAATSAVVTSIVGIVVADAAINVVYHVLGIP
ncbi:MAG: ABC transporter permease [Geminicoccaceae bacterium]